MRIKVKETAFTVKPKQAEGKLLVRNDEWTVKPKPHGVAIYENKFKSVLKHDRRYGVKIQKVNTSKILKQWD